MRVWRLCKPEHAATALDGEGARRFGGRWNPRGVPAVYAASSLSLAALEVLVHVTATQARVAFAAVEIDVPDDLTLYEPDELPDDWAADPAPASSVRLGAAWLERQTTAVLRVPSAVVPLEHNVVLDPLHPDFRVIAVVRTVPFAFDARLLAR